MRTVLNQLSVGLVLIVLTAAVATAQNVPDRKIGTSLTAGIEIRTDKNTQIDQPPTPTLGILHPLRHFLQLSGSVGYTPKTTYGNWLKGDVFCFDLGLRLQDPRGPWSPFIGLFYDLRLYSWDNDVSPQTQLNGGIGIRGGLAYRLNTTFAGELYVHAVRNANHTAKIYGRPDTQQNQSGVVRSGTYYDPNSSAWIFNPTTVGLVVSIRL